jgi:hypothetical protein
MISQKGSTLQDYNFGDFLLIQECILTVLRLEKRCRASAPATAL